MALPPSWGTPHPHPTSTSSSFRRSPHPLTPPPPTDPTGISYSTHLRPVTSHKLVGDKIVLPQGSLEALLSSAAAAASRRRYALRLRGEAGSWEGWSDAGGEGGGDREEGEGLLPHPIIFRLYNPRNGRYTHAVPREFSAAEGEVAVSPFLAEVLGLRDGADLAEDEEVSGLNLTIVFKPLHKGTYVRLRPLEAGYDEQDWKALLERELRLGYSTLTVGEVLSVAGAGGGKYQFLIDKVLPEGSEGVSVVDTDMEVDIEPLSEEQARETHNKKKKKLALSGGQAKQGGRQGGGGGEQGGRLVVGETVEGTVRKGEYIDFRLDKWDRGKGVVVELVVGDGDGDGGGEDEEGGDGHLKRLRLI